MDDRLIKPPPHAKELEEALLGAMILEKPTLVQVCDIIKPEHFYLERHQLICQAIFRLVEQSKPSDYMMVLEELKKTKDLKEVGGMDYILELTGRVSSTINSEHHARIIIQKYIQREIIRKSQDVLGRAYEDSNDVFDLLNDTQAIFNDLTLEVIDNRDKSTNEVLAEFNKALDLAIEKRKLNTITGTVTGLQQLDKKLDGWQKGNLVIVAGRPSMGKTALALGFMYAVMTILFRDVGMFSLEMDARTLVGRLVSMETGIDLGKILSGKVTEHEHHKIQQAQSKFFDKNDKGLLHIDDTSGLTISELRVRAKRMMAEHKLELLVVDYLQLMSGERGARGGREQEISTISRGLKVLARELNIPILALSQLSREVEKSPGCKPMLSHLRESGSIEQDADIVIFAYRPHYYHTQRKAGFEEIQVPGVGVIPSQGYADLIVAKHRNGAVGSVPAKFIDKQAKFEDFNYQEYTEPEAPEDAPY